ncbi:MAG: TIGR02253 family HAD-type hydrolase [Planctomycetes bacterium]|nr:TIGR02253 family HAD-type hydrolase [Planctomycetota bacterium]
MGLRAVLFDIDDTLFSTTQFAKVARRNAVRAMVQIGLDLPEEVVLKELEEVLAEFSSNYDHHFDQLLRRLRPKALENLNPALIVAAGVAAYHDTKFRELKPFEDAIPLLAALRAAGVITGVITHGWTTKQAEKIVRLGLVPHLSSRAVFISDQLGISKPNPKIYALALRDLGLAANEAMYVGDSPSHDITPPKSLGMKAVWAKRASRFHPGVGDAIPDHVVESFDELRTILREQHGLAV